VVCGKPQASSLKPQEDPDAAETAFAGAGSGLPRAAGGGSAAGGVVDDWAVLHCAAIMLVMRRQRKRRKGKRGNRGKNEIS
jgi:hypothetical protein